MKLSDAGREHIIDLNSQLGAGHFQSMTYSSVQLSGHPLTEIDAPPEQAVLRASAYAGYWPGGFPDGQDFVVLVADNPLEYINSKMANVLHQQIQQLRISKRAIERYEDRNKRQPIIQEVRERLGDRLVPNMIQECTRLGGPMSYLTIGKWAIKSAHGTLYGAVLHFPTGIYPQIALANLQANATLSGK